MKKYGEIKDLPFKELKGISQKTIEIHYSKLYQGYVKKWQEIQEKLKAADLSLANATFSDLRELKVEETFSANAVLLHEAYFDILGGEGKPEGEAVDELRSSSRPFANTRVVDELRSSSRPFANTRVVEAIKKDFGSFEKWFEEFKALGQSSRGWVILTFDFNDNKLRNYIADSHNLYGVWGAAPILVLDMYEHAYFIDFGSDKKSYIEAFFENLNWQTVNKKFQKITNF